MTMFDRDYPVVTPVNDPRQTSTQPAFDVVSSWENGDVRTVQTGGQSTNHLPAFPNCQDDDCQGDT